MSTRQPRLIFSFLIILATVLIYFSLLRIQEIHALTKYLGQNYDAAWNATPNSLAFIGDFEGNPGDDSDTNRYHWIHWGFGPQSRVADISGSVLTSLITAEASARSFFLGGFRHLAYICGGIDRRSYGGALNPLKLELMGQWGEGREIMENYTHIGAFVFSSSNMNLAVQVVEVDLMDTMFGNDSTGTPYWDPSMKGRSFPAGYVPDSAGPYNTYDDQDGDLKKDVVREYWRAHVPLKSVGWNFVLLRLGHIAGTGRNNVDFLKDDPVGDFERMPTPTPGDGKFNIREIRNRIGNPYPVDVSDSWLINTSTGYGLDLWRHYALDNGGTTLPLQGGGQYYWRRGDVEGIKMIDFWPLWNPATTYYIDNIIFTTPIPPNPNSELTASSADIMRVNYAWLSDTTGTVLNGTSSIKYYHHISNYSSFSQAMREHYAILTYDITGFIPPNFSVNLAGDMSDGRSSTLLH